MASTTLLWIEGTRADNPSFIAMLRKKGFVINRVATGKKAVLALENTDIDLIVVNAASMRSNGVRVCSSLHRKTNGLPIILIASEGQVVPESVMVNTVLHLPFTVRKLVNRINPLIPGDGKNLLEVGNIILDKGRHKLSCSGRDAKITPRMTNIMEVLMKSPNTEVGRNSLFRKVWKTDYIEDTRTLDVHVSWLRQIIEEDPRNPKILKTIRGVGYKLII